jgi:hypothetical protein
VQFIIPPPLEKAVPTRQNPLTPKTPPPIDRPIAVPDSLASKAGLTKDHVRRKKELGGGFPVFMEGLHQLHCLVGISRVNLPVPTRSFHTNVLNPRQNLLRKSLYYNYDYYHSRGEVEFSDSDGTVRLHVCSSLPPEML